jgi:hypothetical protein
MTQARHRDGEGQSRDQASTLITRVPFPPSDPYTKFGDDADRGRRTYNNNSIANCKCVLPAMDHQKCEEDCVSECAQVCGHVYVYVCGKLCLCAGVGYMLAVASAGIKLTPKASKE